MDNKYIITKYRRFGETFQSQSKLDELLGALEKEKNNLKSSVPIAVKISPDIQEHEINKIAKVLQKYKS